MQCFEVRRCAAPRDETVANYMERQSFLEERLIYVSAGGKRLEGRRWHLSTTCLWSSGAQLYGKVSISNQYPGMERFFTDFLGVQVLTLEMACEELKMIAEKTPIPSVAKIKETIMAINTLLQGSTVLEQTELRQTILESRILPIKYPDGTIELQSPQAKFAIVDRKYLGDLFSDGVNVLYFSLEEVRKLKCFIEWLNLDSCYLSVLVSESSAVTGDEKTRLRHPDRDIRNKAHELYRYVHCSESLHDFCLFALSNVPSTSARLVFSHRGMFMLASTTSLSRGSRKQHQICSANSCTDLLFISTVLEYKVALPIFIT